MRSQRISQFCRIGLIHFVLMSAVIAQAQSVPNLDSVMYQDPRLDIPEPFRVFREDLKVVWIAALRSDEADLRQEAASALVWAAKHGLTDAKDAIAPLIMNLSEDEPASVRLSAARALTVLDASTAANVLFERAREDGLEMAQLVEPALARWDFQPVREVWRARLQDKSAPPAWLLLAIRGLGQVRDAQAAAELTDLAVEATADPVVRLAAAEVVSQVSDQGLEPLARTLMDRRARTPLIERLIATYLLRSHSSAVARDLLAELSLDDASSVAAIALTRLVEIDPDRILPMAEQILAKGDAKVRRLVAQALISRPSSTTIRQLGDLLGDPNPSVRTFVGEAMLELAQSEEWKEDVIEQGERMIKGDRWQPLEQAILLLTRLDQKGQAPRCLELLHHQRPEVYVTAAWALERLGVEETLQPAFDFVQKRYSGAEGYVLEPPFHVGVDAQLAELLQFFGRMRYGPAEPFLRGFVPKSDQVPTARGAAIWALGYLLEGKPDEQLAGQLMARIQDIGPPQPEFDVVRRFSAIALGRMDAQQSVETLRFARNAEGLMSEVGYASAWALKQLTGETYDPPTPQPHNYTNFFLEPLPEKGRRPGAP